MTMRRVTIWKRTLIACAVALAAAPAHANIACVGVVNYLAVNSYGSVYLDIGSGIWAVCSITSALTSSGVTIAPETCRAWYATFLAA